MAFLTVKHRQGNLRLSEGHQPSRENPLQLVISSLAGTLFINLQCPDFGPGLIGWDLSAWLEPNHSQNTAYALIGREGSFPLAQGTAQVFWRKSKSPTHYMWVGSKKVGVCALPPEESPRFWGNLLKLLMKGGGVAYGQEGDFLRDSPLSGKDIWFCLCPFPASSPHTIPVGRTLPVHFKPAGCPWPDWTQEPDKLGPETILFDQIHLVEKLSPCPWIG